MEAGAGIRRWDEGNKGEGVGRMSRGTWEAGVRWEKTE